MPDDHDRLIRRMIGGEPGPRAEIISLAATTDAPSVLIAAAVLTGSSELLVRAARQATTTRDRQLIALALALLAGDDERFDALVRDHLADHPDSLLAAWMATTRPAAPAELDH